MQQLPRRATGQETQDAIFRAMTPDRKVAVGSMLWQLAKALAHEKITYKHGTGRPTASPRGDRRNS